MRVVPNLYPAFTGAGDFQVTQVGPLFHQAPGNGIHEVLVLTPRHEHSWAQLEDKEVGLVMAAIRDRLEDHARHSAVAYTQTIVNHGREAGASLEHPHGQLLGIPFVPRELMDEIDGFARFARDESNNLVELDCLLCHLIDVERETQHRVVIDAGNVLVICPYWSGSPYELLVLPANHQAHLSHGAPADLVAVGKALRDSLAQLHKLIGDVAYNVVFHTAPHHQDNRFHWHIHVVPRITSSAGFEQGTGVRINIVAPEVAAEQLRAM